MTSSKINAIERTNREAQRVVREMELDHCLLTYYCEFEILEGAWDFIGTNRNYVNFHSDTFWLVEQKSMKHPFDHIKWICEHCHNRTPSTCGQSHCSTGIASAAQETRCVMNTLALNLSEWTDNEGVYDSICQAYQYRPKELLFVVGDPGPMEFSNDVHFEAPSCNPQAMGVRMRGRMGFAKDSVSGVIGEHHSWESLAEVFATRLQWIKQSRPDVRQRIVNSKAVQCLIKLLLY